MVQPVQIAKYVCEYITGSLNKKMLVIGESITETFEENEHNSLAQIVSGFCLVLRLDDVIYGNASHGVYSTRYCAELPKKKHTTITIQ